MEELHKAYLKPSVLLQFFSFAVCGVCGFAMGVQLLAEMSEPSS